MNAQFVRRFDQVHKHMGSQSVSLSLHYIQFFFILSALLFSVFMSSLPLSLLISSLLPVVPVIIFLQLIMSCK